MILIHIKNIYHLNEINMIYLLNIFIFSIKFDIIIYENICKICIYYKYFSYHKQNIFHT